MVISTILATMAALVTTRTPPYRGLNAAITVINQPLMVPEVVTAVATLIFFAIIKQATGVTGIGYLIAAHTAFCIPFAYMPIRARLEDMDLSLEQAAADLYAPPFKVFRRVTLPLMMPGIMAGAMLAFIVSLDDVIITLFVAGPGETTLPLYILGQIRRGVTPEINAVSTLFLGISVILVTLIFLFGTNKNKGKQ
jgi:spermidine/putrescine transport system permease protein